MINNGDSAFLILCEELNFTRAAERCFMTQQGLSSHIKKLEEQYGTNLFLRKPNVELTESGNALRLALLKKKYIEDDLIQTIREINNGSIGKIHFGINGKRAAYLAPKILKSYFPKFSKMEIHFTIGDTEKLIRELREGRIDGLLGVNAVQTPDLKVEPLFHEKILLILRDDTAFRGEVSYHDDSGKVIGEISLTDLAAPNGPVFVRNEEGSTLNEVIDRVLVTHNISLNAQTFISDYNVQLSLCKSLGLAVFCPESIVFAENGPAEDPALRLYDIREVKDRMTISLVTNASRYYPESVKVFFSAVKAIFSQDTPTK